jgi:CHAT domain-containing protein
VALDRGDLAGAEGYYQQALAIRQKVAPDSGDMASGLYNLGAVEDKRGERTRAADYFQRALAIWQKASPNSLNVAGALNALGATAAKGGDLARADDYFQQALSIRQKADPVGLRTADSLNNLGELKSKRGDLDGAAKYFEQAMAIFQKAAPESLNLAQVRDNLGELAAKHGDNARAEEFYQQALQVQHQLAPGSLEESKTLHSLGVVLRGSGQIDKSRPFLARAVDAIESQTARLGGSQDVRSSFRAQYAHYYGDLEVTLLDLKQPEQAFQVTERARARSLLQMLAERDLVLSSDVPADIERARKRNAAEYDRTQAQLAQLNPTKDRQKVDELVARLRDLNAERGQIIEKIKNVSPRFASLQYPQPLDLPATRKILDPGTTLLSYGVFEDRTVLFIVQPEGVDPGFSALTLPVSEKELRTKVQEFRRLIAARRQSSDRGLIAQSRQLYDLLLKPVESSIKASDRLLIVSDGPLQILPFAALRRSAKEYLVEWKPLHTVVSATVYAELKKMRQTAGSKAVQLAAFGDPHMPSMSKDALERSEDTELRSASERGFTFGWLPFSRQEVERIAALFPRRTQTYLGADASEEHAKALGKDVRYVHFATHGLLDERFPLNSALVLTIPEKVEEGKENGLLQAWEIFEQVRLDADLVTLSACNSGLGQELNGEGLIGLTRAFQYAGAHSILASLWSVDDLRTMELMKRFYGGLKEGKSKDEALRAAQLFVLHSQPSSSPYYWAAFSLIGDWR